MKQLITLAICLFIFLQVKSQNVGIGTTAPLAQFHVANGTVLFNSDTGRTPLSGAGTRFMWIPGKEAIRAGQVTGTNWDDANIGNFSASFGYNTQAKGLYSFAAGNGSSAIGDQSTAIGYNTQANGNTCMAAGISSIANGDYSTAFGESNTAAASHSFVIGRLALITGTPTSWVDADPLFVVGNGYIQVNGGVGTTIRRNAFSISKLGNISIGGNTSIAGNTTIAGTTTLSGKLEADNGAVINGSLGVNVSAPKADLDLQGALALDSINVTISAAQPTITVGNHSFIKVHATDSNPTAILTNGLAGGQLLFVVVDDDVTFTPGVSNVFLTYPNNNGIQLSATIPIIVFMWIQGMWVQICSINH
jgi:hypothetical protein